MASITFSEQQHTLDITLALTKLKEFVIICSLGEEPVKITKEASRDKFQMRFKKKTCREKARIDSNH